MAHKDPQEQLVTPDLLVHKETQDHKDPQDQLVRQGQPDQLVRQGQPDLPEQPERLGRPLPEQDSLTFALEESTQTQ